ncbi:ABC transporter ATP-binding protein [Abyssibius alkaniclasticus]|uniref:ABC transporter ATP-binding protein n=1 Tax=Abyssibius alkaniclasticus TaxID=2881234 RepID=UPI0023641FE8|nr:ABC transporter ATP-binding protein [Abyssibius alkaniclasticus]UPH71195.1 ABC transporter ATP-binding protein [Abyssibius alkaniclasticus]
MISISRLSQNYGQFQALKDLTLEIPRGEVFGFLGHNGAGKTTTIHILTTLAKPSAGSAKIGGQDCVAAPLLVRRLIGYVPENVRLYDTLTAHENLLFFARLSGVESPEHRIAEVLDFLDASALAPRRVGGFSKGMRQRIGLAQAILHQPDVLFLDEPSSGLDPMGMKMLRDLIVRLNTEAKMTIFMNTHLISEIAKTCTSIGVLSQGVLVYHDRMEAVVQKYGDDKSLEELYLSVTPVSVEGRAA